MKNQISYNSNSPPLILIPLCMGATIYKVNLSIEKTINHSHDWLSVLTRIIHSSPNGLLLFATLNLYRHFCPKHSFYQNLLWISLITLLAFTTEYLQAFKILSGVFDVVDLLFYEYASLITMYLAFNTHLRYLCTNLK